MSDANRERAGDEPGASAPRRTVAAALLGRVATFVMVLTGLWWAALYLLQDRMVFPRMHLGSPAPTLPTRDTVVLTTQTDAGDRVEAWFVPGRGVTEQSPGPLVVYFHGNAELIDFQHGVVDMYRRLGMSVLLPEYRGYGRSGGSPSQAGIRRDVLDFLEQITERLDVDRQRIVYHGRSLGGGVACDVASQRKPMAMILESTFTSVAAMARQFGAPGALVRHPFRNDQALAQMTIPLLIMHGSQDDIIPVSHGRTLRELAPHAEYAEFDCRHNDFPGEERDRYRQMIEQFLRGADLLPSEGNPQ